MHRRLLGIFALAVVVSVSFIAPASAQQGGTAHTDRRISVTGGVVVAGDEVVDGEPHAAHEVPDPAPECQPADSGVVTIPPVTASPKACASWST